MKIAVGSDHRGDAAAAVIARGLREAGHEVDVLGACDGASCDYPDQAYAVGRAVSEGAAERGILVCNSGIGMCMAANKVAGIRAALIFDVEGAAMSRRHNDANVLCLSAERTAADQLPDIVRTWLTTDFEGGRHARRVAKMTAIERGEDPRAATVLNAP